MRQLELWVGDSYSQLLFYYLFTLQDQLLTHFIFAVLNPLNPQDGGDHLPGDAGHVLRDGRLRALLLLRPLLQELDLVEGHVRPPAPPHHEPLLRPPRTGVAGKVPFTVLTRHTRYCSLYKQARVTRNILNLIKANILIGPIPFVPFVSTHLLYFSCMVTNIDCSSI